ncbi:MAG: hypothetical protein OXT09_07905 [Myxococcales bacterium]|nr:hypothetical protein [Myxococcales bacterium]
MKWSGWVSTVCALCVALACSSDDGGDASDGSGNVTLPPDMTPGPGSEGTAGSTGVDTTMAGGPGASPSGGNDGTAGSAGGAGSAGEADGGPGVAQQDAGVDGGMDGDGAEGDAGTNLAELEPFSFFVTSYEAMQRLSGTPDGFGGDLRYGEADGLTGADKICTEIAEFSMPGSGAKIWRAFLSVPNGPGGGPVHAIDRIGDGPWVDRLGRMVAADRQALLNTRPEGAHPMIINDLPNEYGVPNHAPDPQAGEVDNHHMLTGSNEDGELYGPTATCESWTSTAQSSGRPRIGFSWPAGNRQHWISGQDEGGCGAGVDLDGGGGSDPSNPIVGSGGGYGGIYCFALNP